MALSDQVAQIKQAISDEQAALSAAITRVNSDIAGLQKQIADLQAQVANGQTIAADDFNSIIAGLGDATTKLTALDPGPPAEA